MLKQNFVRKVSTFALSGVVLASSLLSFGAAAADATIVQNPLAVTSSVDKAQADRGEVLNYTVNVTNQSGADSSNTMVWFNPLNLATLVSGSASYTRTATNATNALDDGFMGVTNNFGTVPNGQSVVIHFKTTVAQNANMDDILWLISNAKSEQFPTTVSANSWTRVILKNPGICASKTADKTTVAIGDVVTFTIKVCNQGNVVLHNIYVGDVINSPLSYVPGSTTVTVGSQVTKIADSWLTTGVNIGDLNPGEIAYLKLQVTVTNALKDGQTIQNVAQIKSDETPNELQCSVMLTGKVLGVTTPPTTLPNTGPGDMLLIVSALAPLGYALKKFKSKI